MVRMIDIRLLLLLLEFMATVALSHSNNVTDVSSLYAPRTVHCSTEHLLREAKGLNIDEKNYIERRYTDGQKHIRSLFHTNKIPHFDFDSFKGTGNITIALALSGGGYRSMLVGAGIITAFDDRTPSTSDDKWGYKLQGLYQGTSYIAGISGGSWLVVSNYINDNIPLWEMSVIGSVWGIDQPLLPGIPSMDTNQVQDSLTLTIDELPAEISLAKELGSWWFSWIPGLFWKQNNPSIRKRDIVSLLSFKGDLVDNLVQSAIAEGRNRRLNGTSITNSNFSNCTNVHQRKRYNTTNGLSSYSSLFSYYSKLHQEVKSKRQAGFFLSLTDYWGRALAANIFVGPSKLPDMTITKATTNPSFLHYQQPFPIAASIITTANETLTKCELSCPMEFTPYEFGSWDSRLQSFFPIKYLGTSVYDGRPSIGTEQTNASLCVIGYDSAGFIMATSSSLFNRVLLHFYQFLSNTGLLSYAAVDSTLKLLGLGPQRTRLKHPSFHLGQALISPNPFYRLKGATIDSSLTENDHLYLVDGGDDGQIIPFHPFLVPERNVDVVLAYDMTSDYNGYPNGTTINHSQRRYHQNLSMEFTIPSFTLPESLDHKQRAVFPYVPSEKEIMENSLNRKALFLGCDLELDYPILLNHNGSSRTTTTPTDARWYLPPLIIYNANTHISFPTNYSTFKLQYSQQEIYRALNNGFNIATMSNSTVYAMCLNCVLMKREFDRIALGLNSNYLAENYTIPRTCEACYSLFCWHKSR